MNTFKIYKKTKTTSYFTTNSFFVVLSTLITLALILISGRVLINQQHIILKLSLIMSIFTLILYVVLIFVSMFQYEPLNGKLDGSITFENDCIIVGERRYELWEIQKFDIYCGDYYRKRIKGATSDCNPKLSNGVGNYIKLNLDDDIIRRIYFQIYIDGDFLNCREQLINYHLKGKIHFLRLLELLNISEYDEIQQFKEDLKQYSVTP